MGGWERIKLHSLGKTHRASGKWKKGLTKPGPEALISFQYPSTARGTGKNL